MYRNENWEMTKKRYAAWWAHDVVDRPVIRVTGPKDETVDDGISLMRDVKEKWWDAGYIVETRKRALQNTFFGGDAFANFFPSLGTGFISALMGSKLTYTETAPGYYTSWAHPFVKNWKDHTFAFDPKNIYWKKAVALVDKALDEANGEYMVGLPDLTAGIDALSAVRGAENLCMDLLDDPETIKAKLKEALSMFKTVFGYFHQRLFERQGCAPSYHALWYPGRQYTHIADFTAMISAEIYKDVMLPHIEEELEFLEATAYHLDGVDALRHLDMLLSLPKLKVIQWMPGVAPGGAARWMDIVYKKTQEAGKSIIMDCKPEELPYVLGELSPKGLLIRIGCSSESEARSLTDYINRI